MTSRSDPLSLPYARDSAPGIPWRRAAFSFLLTLLAIAVFGASFAVGYARMHDGRALPGVEVAGISLAGLDRAEAETELRRDLPSLASGQLVIDVGDAQQAVAYSAFGRDYDIAFMLDQALGVGRGPNFVEQLQEQVRVLLNGLTVNPQVTWNNDELANRVAHIAMAAQSDPVNATIERVDGRYQFTPSVDGQSVDVEGAVASALAAINNISPADTRISVSTSVVPPAVGTAEAQAAVDLAERVVSGSMTVSEAELSTTITSDMLRGWVRLQEASTGGDWQLVIEREPIAQFVSNHAFETDIAPTNATFGFVSGDVTVVPSADGRATDVEATTDSIMAALGGRANGDGSSQAPLALMVVAPTFTTDDARAIASRVETLSTWTTKFTPSPLNGEGINIQIPTSIIDGYVVEPGALFDFLEVIGPITSPPYLPGAAIINNRTREDGALGGGMCSCSTTLFNTAMRAGLEMRARRNHSYYISRYPVGLDATVWIASARSKQTMSFINDMQYPVLIRGINRPGEVTFELWGVPDGRTVELSEPRVENEKKAIDQIEFSDELAPGVKKRIEYVVDGYESWVTRTVRDSAGNVLHENVYHSKYKTINGIVQVGRYPGDPKAGTIIPADRYRPRTAEAPLPE